VTSGVYAITDTANGHRYIGSSANVARRWSDHRSKLRRGEHRNAHLQRAFDKYGEEAFRLTVLEECAPKELIATEQRWLDKTRPEYNLAATAGSLKGMQERRHSVETRNKIRVALGGRPVEDVRRDLCRELQTTWQQANTLRRSRALIRIYSKAIATFKGGDLEFQIAALEERVAELKPGRPTA
jgi:group I intron endonuclease